MTEKKELTKSEAKDKALRLLGFRAHSEKELLEKLRRAGANPEDFDEIVAFLKEYNFINDSEYARRYAKDLQNLKRYGKRRIILELKNKGISEEDIENALLELSEDTEDVLLLLVRKKLSGNFDRKNIDRAFRYFAYRGYDFDEIKTCVEKVKEECQEE